MWNLKNVLFIVIILLIFGFKPVYASELSLESLGEKGLSTIQIPNDAEEIMEKNDISISEPSSALNINPKKVFTYIWDTFKEKLAEPLKLLGGILAVIIIVSVVEGFSDTMSNDGINKIFKMLSIMVCISIIVNPIIGCIEKTSQTITAGGNFMISYIPVFSSIIAASGSITSAGSYNIIVMAVSEIFTQLAKSSLMPLLGMCLALAVVEGINPSISLQGLINGIKKVAIWGLGFIMTVFVGLLTIQSIVGTSVDTLGVKAGKFVVSSFIPVVGGAISDAYSTIRGSLGIIRGGLGSFGIIALILTVLPTIISIISLQLAVYGGGIAAEIFSLKEINGFLKNVSSILAIALSLVLCFSLMLIISTTIIMLVGMNI